MKFNLIQQPTVTVVLATILLFMQLSVVRINAVYQDTGKSSKGNEFFLGFIGSSVLSEEDESPSATLLVTTDDPDPVSFTVKYFAETVNKTARQGQTVRIVIQTVKEGSDIRVNDINERNKTIHVKAEGNKLLTVYGINDARTATEGFLALPYHKYPDVAKYKYFVFSMKTEDQSATYSSRFLIVGCEANTTVKVTPTATTPLPQDIRDKHEKQIKPNKDKEFIINSSQTLMLQSPDDLTGTIIRSDKPISVFVGHECGKVPQNKDHCNHLVEQIPPDITWGTRFFTVPLGLRKSGERYRVGTLSKQRDPTIVTVTCTTEGETQSRLVKNETIFKNNYTEFDTTVKNDSNRIYRREFCCIETTKPSIVMMYAKGDSVDNVKISETKIGNPIMVLVPPVSQYSNNFTISTVKNLTVVDPLYSYVGYALPVEYFNNTDADRAAFTVNNSDFTPDSDYHPIFCSDRQICGYGAYSPINKEGNHIIRYNKMTAGMYLYVYHFMKKSTGDSTSPMIAYPAGFNMDPILTCDDNCSTTTTVTFTTPTTTTTEPEECLGDWTDHLTDEKITPDNIIDVLTTLAQLSVESVGCQVDQTPGNLDRIARIFNMIANITQTHRLNLTTRNMIVNASVQIVNSLIQWNVTVIEAEASSRIILSFEAITATYSQELPQNATKNFPFPYIILSAQMSDLKYLLSKGITFKPSESTVPSIHLPPSLFQQIQESTDNNSDTGVPIVFTLYENSTLFPVGEYAKNNTDLSVVTQVATKIIAAHVAQDVDNLQDPVIIILQMEKDFLFKLGSERCVSWDFTLQDWTTRGCSMSMNQEDIFTCTCDHLTNFAVLMDVCLRLEDCQPTNPVVGKLLTYVSYFGIVFSIIGLILTIITTFVFKKLRRKDGAEHHIQLSVSLLLLMIVSLVLIILSPGTTDVIYGGCMSISVLVHYFALVAVMWMGAEALLMFRKVVIVFVRITTTYLVIISLICWLVPLVPVLIPLVVDLSLGNDPSNDIIIRRSGDEESTLTFCFLSHVGAFWGAFLGPILLVMVFNVITFVCIIFVLIRHVCNTSLHVKQKIKSKEVVYMMIRIGGVMSLFGLTWLFAILTIPSPGLREVFQILFTVFNSFQGVFIFIFFCIMNEEARKSWKEFFFGKFLRNQHFKTSKFSSHDHHKTSEHALESLSIGMSPLPTKSEKIEQSINNSQSEVKVDLSENTEKQPI